MQLNCIIITIIIIIETTFLLREWAWGGVVVKTLRY
jgi:hypothetical protein